MRFTRTPSGCTLWASAADLTAAELSALVEQFTGSANPQPSEA